MSCRHLALLSAGIILAFMACQTPEASPPREAAAPEAGLHVTDNVRLRDIMRDLRDLNFAEISSEMKRTGDSSADLEWVADMALPLARDARIIPLIFQSQTMTSEDQRKFDDMAVDMRARLEALHEAAIQQDATATQLALDRVIDSCNACHDAFRGPVMAYMP